LRILIVTGVRRQKEAGAAGVALNHARELEKLGHQVECWFLDDILKRPVKPRFEALIFATAIARRIVKDASRFDVVNIHAPWGCVYGVWRKLFRPKGALPYILTMQGSEERYVYAMRREDRKGRALNFSLKNRLWHRIYHQVMYDLSIRTADYGAVADREAWICAELMHDRNPGVIWYVPNGTEERFFMDREYAEKSPSRLLYVGTWLDRKGVYYLADAFKILARINPDIRMTIAGCMVSDKEVRKYFAAELRDRVAVVPFVKREDMPAIYAEHDIFVCPSLVEGMPLTLLEAMAAGMPVVTTNTCGMPDVVEDEFNGLVVQTADAEKLAAAIGRFCNSTMLRKQLGLEGQRTVRRYTWGHVTQKLENILVLAARNAGHN